MYYPDFTSVGCLAEPNQVMDFIGTAKLNIFGFSGFNSGALL